MGTTSSLRLLAAGALCSVLVFTPLARAATQIGSVPPSGKLDFKVYKDGTPIGHHRYRFVRSGDVLNVHVDIELVVRIAFIPVYRYRHESHETWSNGRLVALESKTHDDGRDLTVSARTVGNRLEVRGPSGTVSLPAGIRPGSHWNAANLREKTLFDTQWGSLIAIDVKPVAAPAPTRRFNLTGHELKDGVRQSKPWLDIDLWFDSGDILSGMEFHYRGYNFRYVPN